MRAELPLPSKPPYTVHLGNMSFDATEGDVQDFFAACSVTSVRIVEDKLERKPKGFGYAEFATLDGLKKALEFNGSQFQGRNIKVSVAEPRMCAPLFTTDWHDQRFANRPLFAEKDRPDAREFGDWTRKGPLSDVGGQRRVSDRAGFGSGSGARGFDSGSDVGSERGSRRPAFEGDGKARDFGNWDRKGPLTPTLPTGNAARSMDRPISHDGPGDRRNSPAWGEGRSQDGSRPPRREFVERPVIDRAPTAPEMDNQWRSKMKPDAPPPTPAPTPAPVVAKSPALSHRELSTPPSPAAPTVRPKLNLAKRTVSEAPADPVPASATSESKASPFGAAKPIDTAARDKEVEERRQAALREKKEAEDKAREEKKAAEEKSREEKRVAREAERAKEADKPKEKPDSPTATNEDGVQAPPAGKNYEILRRAANEDGAAADEEGDGENANGSIVDDKAVKPKNIVRDAAPKTNGASPHPDASAKSTADALEEDGWETVAKPVKKGRIGNQPRAIAS